MKLAVVGSRSMTCDLPLVYEVLYDIHRETPITLIVSGGARGIDSFAEEWATENGVQKLIFYPDWQKHGKAAGMIRNAEIVNAADKVLAFWDGRSPGTKNSIDRAEKVGKLLDVHFGIAQILQGSLMPGDNFGDRS